MRNILQSGVFLAGKRFAVPFIMPLNHFNNGNVVPMRSGSFSMMETERRSHSFPREMTSDGDDHCYKRLYSHSVNVLHFISGYV